MITRLKARQEWAFFSAAHRAAPSLSVTWWLVLVLRGVMLPLLALATGSLVGAVNRDDSLTIPLVFVGVVFIAFQVLTPVHFALGMNLGSRTSNWLNEQLMVACIEPPGVAHLERTDLINDLTMARDFDLGITGPPLSISMDFIASGLVQLVSGLAAALVLFGFAWWAPIVLVVGWGSTHWMLRESAVWRDRNTNEVRDAQRHADYAYRLAVDAPAAKEVRLFGLADWVVDRFVDRRRRLYELQWRATRLRERPVLGCLAIVTAANVLVFWQLADGAVDGRLDLEAVVVYVQTAIGTSAIAFGGLSWALDGAAAPAAAVARLGRAMAPSARWRTAHDPPPASRLPTSTSETSRSPIPTRAANVLEQFDLTIPAGGSLAIVGQNGAGKTTLAKLLCRLYDPVEGTIEIDGIDLRDFDLDAWRSRVTAVFQDFVRYETTLRKNVAPRGDADDGDVLAALVDAGADELAHLDTILARRYEGGTDLSGGQWQRVALARALCGVRLGAGVVLLDEPTAQLDVRGEAEIFERLLAATRHCTTILISHRFSTVRHADRICVLEHGRVIELGTHDELMALDGRYKTMFELQASRFVALDERGEEVAYETLA